MIEKKSYKIEYLQLERLEFHFTVENYHKICYFLFVGLFRVLTRRNIFLYSSELSVFSFCFYSKIIDCFPCIEICIALAAKIKKIIFIIN
jgi:hypothetical protein